MSERELGDAPVIGVMRWAPGAKRPAVREVPPERCPFRGHDLRQPGSLSLSWAPGTGRRLYTCAACYKRDGTASWQVLRDDAAMWSASGLTPSPEWIAKHGNRPA